jgi:DNA-directed RNA polymerase specialized sigma24 family protein
MKTSAKKTEEPPSYSDLDAWRRIAACDGLHRLRPEDVVAAIQRIGPKGDQRLLDTLMGHISDEMLRLLRRRISTRHRNNGNDAIESAHDKLIVAVLKPNSADGKGLREAFRVWVNFRADDAIVVELRESSRYTHYETNDEGETIEPPDGAAPDHVEQVAYVEHLLSKIPDPRKCLAFRLHMDGCPVTSEKGTESIARTLGVSDKTARAWIAEVQTLLKKELGDTNDRT